MVLARPDRLTGLDGGPGGVAPVLVQVLDGDNPTSDNPGEHGHGGEGPGHTTHAEAPAITTVDLGAAAETVAADPAAAGSDQSSSSALLSDDPVAALRQSISAAGAQLGALQSLRQERDGLQQRCQALEEELEGCRLALQQSQQQLAAARQQLAEVNALQQQLQQLLTPQSATASAPGDPPP